MKRIAILGSTGSIGRSTLSVVESYPDRFQIATLAAGTNTELAFEQAVRWKPMVLSVAKEQDAETLRTKLRSAGHSGIEVVQGAAGTATGPSPESTAGRSASSRDVPRLLVLSRGPTGKARYGDRRGDDGWCP